MPKVTFEPLAVTVEAAVGESIFDAGRRNGVPIPTACVGNASCGLCRVKVLSGRDQLSPLNASEVTHLGNTYFITHLRLSCQARLIGGDVVVRIPDAVNPLA